MLYRNFGDVLDVLAECADVEVVLEFYHSNDFSQSLLCSDLRISLFEKEID